MKQQRLKAEDRCQAIMQALRDVFAEKGFDGTTTRELAKAAGVSEALLYRHFPSKEAMYAAMTQTCLGDRAEEFKQIMAMEPSASTLVLITHFMVSYMVFETNIEKKATDVLAIRSLLSDGEFMRVLFRERGCVWHKKIHESLKAAQKAGDAYADVPTGDFADWLGKSVGLGMGLLLMPSKPVMDTKLSRVEMTERCVWFILLGMGVKPETIRKHYNPKGLSLLASV